jgi:NhaP-type Na+/H+ or K+/H+ antiporter
MEAILGPEPGYTFTMPSSVPWFLIAGVLLVVMAMAGSVLKRLPLSASVLYLVAGYSVGPHGLNLLRLDPVGDAHLLEVLTEVAVLISLFSSGLKLGPPLTDRRWWIPVRLASVGMVLTIALITAVGVYLLHLPLGAAVLLGAVLAPTDPVLASDVQVAEHTDRDRLRFGLTGEAGMNDGTAFPFVMLGMGLLGLHPLGESGVRWVVVDLLWSVIAGVGIGYGMGWLIGSLVLYLRRVHREAVGLDEFLTMGLIALSYGVALLCHAYGFLAVFAAGLALRRIERDSRPDTPPDAASDPLGGGMAEDVADPVDSVVNGGTEEQKLAIATDPEKAPAYLTRELLSFNEQLERIGEVVVVLFLGAMLSFATLPTAALWFVPLLFFVIRPVATWSALARSRTARDQRALMAWFGIRGIGSVYYLAYAIGHGVPEHLARPIAGLTLAVIAASIVAHGISVTPLMAHYQQGHKTGTAEGS